MTCPQMHCAAEAELFRHHRVAHYFNIVVYIVVALRVVGVVNVLKSTPTAMRCSHQNITVYFYLALLTFFNFISVQPNRNSAGKGHRTLFGDLIEGILTFANYAI